MITALARETHVRRIENAEGDETTEISLRCPRCDCTVVATEEDAFLPPAYERPHLPPAPADDAEPSEDAGAPLLPGVTPVSDLMTRDVICLRDDMTARAARSLFLAKDISGAPVVSRLGNLIGVVSKTDLIRDPVPADRDGDDDLRARTDLGYGYFVGDGFHEDENSDELLVSEIMTPTPIAIGARADVAQAAAMMAWRRVHRVVVMSDDGQIVGLLSASDIVRWVASGGRPDRRVHG